MCHAQTCGKCVPCRVGSSPVKAHDHQRIKRRCFDYEILDLIEETALSIIPDRWLCHHRFWGCENGGYGWSIPAVMILKLPIRNKTMKLCDFSLVPCVALCPCTYGRPRLYCPCKRWPLCRCYPADPQGQPISVYLRFYLRTSLWACCRCNMVDTSQISADWNGLLLTLAGKVAPPACGPSTGKRSLL